MPNSCTIPNCKSGYASNPIKRRMFFPPKDENLFKQWEKVIPKQGPLKRTHCVCELHFEETDIIKGKIFIINGKEDFFPMTWKLKKGAIPRIFPGIDIHLHFYISGCYFHICIYARLSQLLEQTLQTSKTTERSKSGDSTKTKKTWSSSRNGWNRGDLNRRRTKNQSCSTYRDWSRRCSTAIIGVVLGFEWLRPQHIFWEKHDLLLRERSHRWWENCF